MATLLDDRLVAGAMENLDEWTGDASRISRTVQLDDLDGLLASVQEAADALDHHPEIERDASGVTFVLWTHSQGGVTELDIALASRIDDLVLKAQHLERDAKGEVHSVDEPAPGEGGAVTAEPNLPTAATGAPYPAERGEGADAPE